ncbi:acetyl-CoA synthetase-like protein [Annulohypoxylon truncatum]|uniref:acetyl-CoA synthetase-like protein n=1 Tax=Annulohypoxylon truncatum TaxID=327061 RepID=UPI0020088F5E|nr:acetyl-CoA synthetase-like protein [Annulohypoxylon truncatum]KAI1214331.1 acetyl-CoA synthetase-like protein [Annulohypoxylon truncatum]
MLEKTVSVPTENGAKTETSSLLSDLDKEKLCMWNKRPSSHTQPCVDTLIHERCLSRPTAPAVCAWDGEFSYGELDDLSSALAQHLAALGVGPEVFVPLCFEKSRWTTVAMLGVTKAGGAFVLLDPSHPEARLQRICQLVSAKLIVSSAQCAKLAANLVATVVEVRDGDTVWLAGEGLWTSSSAVPENALYAIFTSGSTGTPKGVVSQHSSFDAAIRPYTEAVGLDQESRVFQSSSYAFDVTIFDTFMTLINGGCICVPSDNDRLSDIAKAIEHFRVTHSSFTPTVARILHPTDLPTLRTLVLGGERLTIDDVAKWVGHVRVLNLYGASECTIMSIQLMTGSALQNTDYATGSARWIVDPNDHEKLLPIGAIGELIIEGPIVGRGYLGSPVQTSCTFIQPPRWLRQLRGPEYCRTLYKSGDLAQYTADGSIRVIGRKDTQVKLRGQRIELGEVEHHVRLAIPSARYAIAEVVVTPGSSWPPMLVAFIYSGNEPGVESREQKEVRKNTLAEPSDSFRSQIPAIQSRLQQSLPSYMVPSVFLPLAALPLTSTDKTNRKALRELVAALSREELERYQPPTTTKRTPLTATEKLLQLYFSQALNLPVDEIGADDHFFYRGGDSLTAMKLVAMARKDKHIFTVQDVFNHPRLSTLACIVRRGTNDIDEAPPKPFSLVNKQRDEIRAAAQQCGLPVRAIEDLYPCTPLQRGLMFETMRDAKAYIATITLRLPIDIDLQRLKESWIAVAAAHPILRTRMVLSPSYSLVQAVIREDIQWIISKDMEGKKFSVGIGKPLVQLHLCCEKGNPGRPYLLLMIHHAVYDGWTLPLIFAEVEAAYHGRTLAPRPVSAFIHYLQSAHDSESYWSSLMEGLQTPTFPTLPSKIYHPSPDATMHVAIITSSPYPREFTKSAYVRLAWAITVAQHSETNDVFFGTVVSGRNAPVAGIELMTIPTVATVPCRVTLDIRSPVQSVLQKIQDDMMTSIPFEQLGLPEMCRIGEHVKLACSFQTLLVIQPGVTPNTFSWVQETDSALDYRADAIYAINLFCGLEGDEMKVTSFYDSNVVREDEMQRILTNFSHALRGLYQSPDSLVGDIIDG